MTSTPIKDAATIIIVRNSNADPSVLMGQRGAKAAFMPGKFVFPGGAVDPTDASVPLQTPLPARTKALLAEQSTTSPDTLASAAIRELWEETGQILGKPDRWAAPPDGWHGFSQTGYRPAAHTLDFIFRAVTPPGRPRRFDARFFLTEATALASDPDDFSTAEDELSHLQWIPLAKARQFDLPFITQVVLAEVAQRISGAPVPHSVPFFRNDDEDHLVTRLEGRSPLDPTR